MERLKTLVGERGFEPPTPWSRTRCSTRLSHSPTVLEGDEKKTAPGAAIRDFVCIEIITKLRAPPGLQPQDQDRVPHPFTPSANGLGSYGISLTISPASFAR